ncbi:nucleotidyltransferase [Clostridiaceae bacterium]|nr:nucleotidyltransferase [Clostridiaceae bacterium]
MKNTTLVIMAAGLGSRFGTGIKQLEPVGPNGEIIMDYSIHDGLEAGFNKVVFIIRKDLEAVFKQKVGRRVEDVTKVEYAYQELLALPEGYKVPEGRTKPWGTGQAVLSIKGLVHEPFVVINADDYYGKEAFRKIHDYMVQEMDTEAKVYDICMAGFILSNTLSENGSVTRGVCRLNEDGTLNQVKETYEIWQKGTEISACDEEGNPVLVRGDQQVSMNMWGLPPAFLDELERGFPVFLDNAAGNLKAEYLLPKFIDELIQKKKAQVKVLETRDKWFGVTYQEDKAAVAAAIQGLVEKGVYKENLYNG